MNTRDRRALILGGAVVGAAVLLFRVLPSVVRHGVAGYGELGDRAALLARARAELSALPELRDSTAVLTRALVALAPQVLSGASAAEAGADLSGRVNLLASRAPAKVERLDLVPITDSIGPERLGRARVHAALETDVRGLLSLLRGIETGDGVLTLEELRVVGSDPGASERAPEMLKIEVTVSGWFIKSRQTKAET